MIVSMSAADVAHVRGGEQAIRRSLHRIQRPTSASWRCRKISSTYSGHDSRLAPASMSGMLGCADLSWLSAEARASSTAEAQQQSAKSCEYDKSSVLREAGQRTGEQRT